MSEADPKRSWKIGSYRELVSEDGLRALFAECFGTFMLVLIASGGINPRVIGQLKDNAPLFNLSIAVGVGMTIGLMVYVCVETSGGHINPSISVMFFLDTQVSFIKMVAYIVVQYIGAFVAAGVLWGIGDYEGIVDYTATTFESFSVWRALAFEIFGQWLFILVTLAAVDPRRGHADSFLQPFAIGLSNTIALLFMGPYVISGLNPCVIAWYVVSGSAWPNYWVFAVGPVLGAITAVGIYNGIMRPYKTEKSYQATTKA